MRLIDADSIKWHRTTECGGHGVFLDVDMVYKEEIDAIPTIDPESQRRWIPVTERPPEKEGWYLVFSVTFKDVAFFAPSEGWGRLNTREGRMEPYPYRVTHWMPLPEPPESEDKKKKKYELRPMVCDWALDIPMGDTTVELYFNSRNNAEQVKAILEWEDAHPNEAAPYPEIAAAMADQLGRLL